MVDTVQNMWQKVLPENIHGSEEVTRALLGLEQITVTVDTASRIINGIRVDNQGPSSDQLLEEIEASSNQPPANELPAEIEASLNRPPANQLPPEIEGSRKQLPAKESNSNELPTIPLPIQTQVVKENQSSSIVFTSIPMLTNESNASATELQVAANSQGSQYSQKD